METITGFVSTKFRRGNEKYHQLSVSVKNGDAYNFIQVKAFAGSAPDAYKTLKRCLDHDRVELQGHTQLSEYNGKTYASFIASSVVIK